MRKLWLVMVVAVLAVGAANAQASPGRLDRSFGNNGVVPVDPPAPWGLESVRKMAAAPDGSSYVLADRWTCPSDQPCRVSLALFRYTATGVLDSTFGGSGGAWELSRDAGGGTTLAVDSEGRPLIAFGDSDQVVVYRLDQSGVLDPSFGVGGSVSVPCTCSEWQMQLVPGPRGSVTVASPSVGGGPGSGTSYTLSRLRGDGSLDPDFGAAGTVTLRLPGYSPFFAPNASKSGTIYMSSQGCCGPRSSMYLGRISAKGRFDWHFFVTARRSLRSLKKLDGYGMRVRAALVRPRGTIDLLGYGLRYENGFSLRLKPDGHLVRGFGTHGLRILPVPVVSAALGSDGATMAVSDGSVGPIGFVMRILPGGRLDPKFGWRSIPGSQGDNGISIVPQAGRKALVLDLGLHECRGYCTVDPKLVRFLEGPRRKRR